MANGELYLPPQFLIDRVNPKTGCFMKGHEPFNKGRKWGEYVKKRSQKRMSKGWINLTKYRPKTRPDTAGRCRKQVIAVFDDGSWKVFSYLGMAAQILGGSRENIGRCCRLNKARHVNRKTGKINTDHRYNNIRFYFENDSIWTEKIKQ